MSRGTVVMLMVSVFLALVLGLTVAVVFSFHKINSLQEQLDVFKQHVSAETTVAKQDYQGAIEALGKQVAETEEELAGLRGEIVSATKSMLLKKIVDTAAAQALDTLATDRTLLTSQQFIDAVAQGLASNHRQRLQGVRGLDADNESVAKFLIADPEFLSRVSVSLLLQDEQ